MNEKAAELRTAVDTVFANASDVTYYPASEGSVSFVAEFDTFTIEGNIHSKGEL